MIKAYGWKSSPKSMANKAARLASIRKAREDLTRLP